MPPRSATLGTGEWTAEFRTRGGASTVGYAPISGLSASPLRVLDQTSTATITLPTPSPSSTLARVLLQLRPWEHELHLYRDDGLEWLGPLVDPMTFGGESISLTALDLSGWLDRRISTDRQWRDTDLAIVARELIEDAMGRDTSPNIDVEAYAALTHGELDVIGDNLPRAMDALRDLAGRGLDFTVINRTLRIGGQNGFGAPDLGVWDTRAFGDLTASFRGSAYGSEWHVLGQADSTGTMAHGEYGGVGQSTGLVQQVFQDDSILDDAGARLAAEANWRFGAARQPYVESAPLSPQAPVAFSDLIPSATVEVRATAGIMPVEGSFRITQVDVSVGDDAAETVSVTLQPVDDPAAAT